MAKKDFLTRRPSVILNSKIFIFVQLAVIEFQTCCCLPKCIEIGWFSIEMTTIYRFKMADVRHLVLSKFGVYVV